MVRLGDLLKASEGEQTGPQASTSLSGASFRGSFLAQRIYNHPMYMEPHHYTNSLDTLRQNTDVFFIQGSLNACQMIPLVFKQKE